MSDGIKRYKNSGGSVRFKVNLQIEGIRIRKQDFHTKKEATAYLQRMRLLILTGSYQDYLESEKEKKKIQSDVSLKEYGTEVFEKKKCRDIRESTLSRYIFGMKQNVYPLLGKKKLRTITSRDFERLKEDMLSKGYKRGSINHPLSALIYVLKRAKSEGLLENIPQNTVSFVQSKKNVFLTDDELKRLFRAIDLNAVGKREWFRVYVYLQLNTFARVGELLALNWSDIDFQKGTIAINKQYDPILKKVTETKNSKTHNSFPLSEEMMSMLRRYKIKCGFCPYVFPNGHYFSEGSKSKNKNNRNIERMRRSGVAAMLKKFADMADIERKRLSSHVLRKTGGDRLLRSGFTIHQVAHALRIDAKTVLWTYSTLDNKAFEEKLSAFRLLNNDNVVASNDNVEMLREGEN